jgi:hypothetical protein
MAPQASTEAARPASLAASGASGLQALLAGLDIDFRRVYMNAVVGGAGGLVGWLLLTLLSAMLPFDLNIYVKHLIAGPFVGAAIGFAVGATDGLLAARSRKRALRGGGLGAAIGAAGGLVGLVLGELIFDKAPLLQGTIWARALGWGIFGMFVGTCEGVAAKMPLKVRYGILGGLLGGLIGGATYQAIQDVLGGSKGSGLFWGGAIGLVILGACIGFMISLVESLLRKAWLFFLTGRLEGQTRTLDSSRPHSIGSADTCSIVIPNDPNVAPVHAEVSFVNGEFEVRPRDGQVIVRRDGMEQPVTAHILAPGDRLSIGGTRMIFRNVEAKKR